MMWILSWPEENEVFGVMVAVEEEEEPCDPDVVEDDILNMLEVDRRGCRKKQRKRRIGRRSESTVRGRGNRMQVGGEKGLRGNRRSL